MWFAALGNVQDNPWFVRFLVRLLEGSPEVLGLLRTDPFPDHPPRYVRAVVYDYHFTRYRRRPARLVEARTTRPLLPAHHPARWPTGAGRTGAEISAPCQRDKIRRKSLEENTSLRPSPDKTPVS